MRIRARYKVCRRLNDGVFAKCQTAKYTISETKKKTNAQRKKRRRRSNPTPYGLQLLEKQKVRFTYGVSERQLANYVKKARKDVSPTESLFRSLENRLDNVIYRLGLVTSRQFARQAVSHGHIAINGKRMNIPSYQVRVGDKISIQPRSRDNGIFKEIKELIKNANTPKWFKWKAGETAEMVAQPVIGEYDSNLNFGTLIEFYSRV
jgi:small subunit ribosomal protein S4